MGRSLAPLRGLTQRQSLLFIASFAALLGVLALLFEVLSGALASVYLYPSVRLAVHVLHFFRIAAEVDPGPLPSQYCLFVVGAHSYRVVHECTGLFALLVFLALVGAYPATLVDKVKGMAMGVPAFFAYGVLRLVILGVVARWQPAWVEFFHYYMMVLVNLGFMLFVWIYWLEEIVHSE